MSKAAGLVGLVGPVEEPMLLISFTRLRKLAIGAVLDDVLLLEL